MCDTFSRSDRGRGQYVVRDFSHALVEEPKTDKISHSQADGLETTIGPGCDIGAGTVIGGGTCIGRDTRTGNTVTLTNCDVGERCYFHNGVAIGQDGFGFKHGSDGEVIKHKQEYRVQIGDNVEIGAVLLKTLLAKNANEGFAAAASGHQQNVALQDTNKLKKQISVVCERLARGSSLSR